MDFINRVLLNKNIREDKITYFMGNQSCSNYFMEDAGLVNRRQIFTKGPPIKVSEAVNPTSSKEMT